MKQIAFYAFILGLIIFGVIVSCSRSVVLDIYKPKAQDTSTYTPRAITRADTTEAPDTARIPISFGVTIDGWGDETDIDL